MAWLGLAWPDVAGFILLLILTNFRAFSIRRPGRPARYGIRPHAYQGGRRASGEGRLSYTPHKHHEIGDPMECPGFDSPNELQGWTRAELGLARRVVSIAPY